MYLLELKEKLRLVIYVFGLIAILGNIASSQQDPQEQDEASSTGRVYIMPNRADGNTIMAFSRGADGSLTFFEEVSTGGLGSGPGELPSPFPVGPGPNPLTSQDDLIITEDGQFLVAVNAGSNDVSVFAVTDRGLLLTDRVPTRGIFPVSIAAHNGLIYVLNEGQDPPRFIGGTPTITGFHLTHEGKLVEIPNSTLPTGDPNAEPADVVFSRDGKRLIIPDKFAGTLIHVFRVLEDGALEETFNIPANTPTPFGAAFAHHGVVLVVEANAGLVNGRRQGVVDGATMSSYRLTDDNALQPISKAVPMNQTVGCWVRITPNGRFAYITNTGDGSVSSYTISERGELTLLAARAADTGGPFSGPVDEDITPDGKFLYVVSGFSGELLGYRIGADGSLTPVARVEGLTRDSLVGAVAR
jgi:6-phosphogluconolactonase (cycloisomerase 2 family)